MRFRPRFGQDETSIKAAHPQNKLKTTNNKITTQTTLKKVTSVRGSQIIVICQANLFETEWPPVL